MTDANRHTPGPWIIIPAVPYDGDDDGLQGCFTSPAGIEGSDGRPVCTFGSEDGSGTLFENEADYKLIAAAPDILEALRRVKFDHEEIHDLRQSTLDLVNAALARCDAA